MPAKSPTSSSPSSPSTSKFFDKNAGNVYSAILSLISFGIGTNALFTLLSYVLPPQLATAGHFQFLTNLSLLLSIIFWFFNIINHIVKNNYLEQFKLITLWVATTLETIVFLVYWPLRLLAPGLIIAGEYIPLWVDLSIHFVPFFTLTVEYYCFSKPCTLSFSTLSTICYTLTTVYWVWLHSKMDETSSFPYPFLAVKTDVRVIIFFVIGSTALSCILLNKLIYSKIWKNEIETKLKSY
ncbi:hypothetical protein BVG19_g3137 [[Candida] boidinii]|nr:hypothetical protein BVG19_g3137 [[Candida] boidinii]OWB53435.1 hypothetical protein B5S27_g5031 [[Candida] boidinii]